MTKEKFLTVRWNNVLTLALGIPTFIYVLAAFSNIFWTTRDGLIGLALIGVVYWIGIEYHTSVRFAWLQENSTTGKVTKQASAHPLALIRTAYNIVFWVFLLPFLFAKIDYGTGFLWFTIVIFMRLILNLITNNFLKLTPQQFEQYPFRIP